jgi:hypothetical protein
LALLVSLIAFLFYRLAFFLLLGCYKAKEPYILKETKLITQACLVPVLHSTIKENIKVPIKILILLYWLAD